MMVYFGIWLGWAVLSSAVIVGAVYWLVMEERKPSWERQHCMLTLLQMTVMSCLMTIAIGSLLALAIMATVNVARQARAW